LAESFRHLARNPASPRVTAWLKPRALALLIDMVVALLIAQLATAAAFALTGGKVQGSTLGFSFESCQPITQLPELTPPPTHGATLAVVCQRSIGLPLSSMLVVFKVGKSEAIGNAIRMEQQVYTLGSDGSQVSPILHVTTPYAFMVLILYLAAADWLTGASLGKFLVGLRTVDANDRHRNGISLPKALARNAIMQAVPLLLAALTVASSWFPFLEGYVAALFWPSIGVWVMYNMNWMLRQMDPTYDHLSGTTVVSR
jgi:uncharacterized RDD family membrane protein YckC